MTRICRPLPFVLLLALAACATSTSAPEGSALYGRWRNVSSKLYLSDGTERVQPNMQCVLEVSERQMVTECLPPKGPRYRAVAKIISLDARNYEVEIVENSVFPQAVGVRSRAEYRIEGNKRYTTVYPDPFKPPGMNVFSVKLESVDIRE